MNDIRLGETTRRGKYDWIFGWNDLDTIRGNLQLVNAVRHAVLTRKDELVQEPYQGRGCEVHEYIYRGNTEEERQQQAKLIENAANSVTGVYDARCTIEKSETESNLKLELITTDYEEVIIDGI